MAMPSTRTPVATHVCARCGDGVVQSDVEACDDGNDIDTDACLDLRARTLRRWRVKPSKPAMTGMRSKAMASTIARVRCATASLGPASNAMMGMKLVAMSSRHLHGGSVRRWNRPRSVEQCDDGNDVDTDACRTNCTAARCGTALLGPRAMHDGNDPETDACKNDCTGVAAMASLGLENSVMMGCGQYRWLSRFVPTSALWRWRHSRRC